METANEKILDVTIRTLEDLENCEWNGTFKSSYNCIQVFNLQQNGITFMEKSEFGMHIKKVRARVSNFEVRGRTFEVDASTKLHKYDGSNGEMYFLQGLHLNDSKEPSYYLEFLVYEKGLSLPKRIDFILNKKNVVIPV